MKKIEFIYPEFTNIYGECYNIEYLKKSSDELEVIMTHHLEKPRFLTADADMVYIGCMTERHQEKTIELLRGYRGEIEAAIAAGTIFLVTGNAIEIFGNLIKENDLSGNLIKEVPALGLFDFYSVRNMDLPRHNSQYIATFEDMTLLGHRSQFSFSYGEFKDYFLKIETGIGMNPETGREGIHVNNFFATYSLGPYLIFNPYFVKYLLRLMGLNDEIAFEKNIIEAYNYRLNELRRTLT